MGAERPRSAKEAGVFEDMVKTYSSNEYDRATT